MREFWQKKPKQTYFLGKGRREGNKFQRFWKSTAEVHTVMLSYCGFEMDDHVKESQKLRNIALKWKQLLFKLFVNLMLSKFPHPHMVVLNLCNSCSCYSNASCNSEVCVELGAYIFALYMLLNYRDL